MLPQRYLKSFKHGLHGVAEGNGVDNDYYFAYGGTEPTQMEATIARFDFPMVTSINEEDSHQNGQFIVYPNPNNGYFYITSDHLSEGEVIDLRVYDYTGRLVFDRHSPFVENEVINLSELTSGYYLLVLSNDTFKATQPIQIH